MKQRTFLGKARGCSLIRSALNELSVEQIEKLKQQMRDYPHLYPCPLAGMNWGYKTDCDFCDNAVREK